MCAVVDVAVGIAVGLVLLAKEVVEREGEADFGDGGGVKEVIEAQIIDEVGI